MTDLPHRIPCRLCEGDSLYRFEATVLGKYPVKFYRCSVCCSLQTEQPYWLGESYADARRPLDTSAVLRASFMQTAIFFLAKILQFKTDDTLLDWGAGDGLLVRMLRDVGLDAYWWDDYATNVYAIGFEGHPQKQYSLVTAFEVWEHLPDPRKSINELLGTRPDVHILSTHLYSDDKGPDWGYLNLKTGRHVFFYSRKAINEIASQYGYRAIIFKSGITILFRRKLSTLRVRLIRSVFDQPVTNPNHWKRKVLGVLFSLILKRSLWAEDQKMLITKMSTQPTAAAAPDKKL